MAAVVFRVKRKLNENAADAFMVSCKRSRCDEACGTTNEDSENIHGRLNFAATIPVKSDLVSKCVREAVRKEKLQNEIKQHSYPDLMERRRNVQRMKTSSNRFKVVSSKRGVNLEDLDKSEDVSVRSKEDDKLYQLYDIIEDDTENPTELAVTTDKKSEADTVTCNGVPLVREKVKRPENDCSADYVYDIYYLNKRNFDFESMNNILKIEAMTEEYIYDDYRCAEVDEVYDYEEDENAESNWRNDYPDEDPQYIENWQADYHHDDVRDMFDSDDWGLTAATGQLTLDEEEVDSESDDRDVTAEDGLWAPSTSYEAYKKRVMAEMNTDNS